jgi:hypothetical protein
MSAITYVPSGRRVSSSPGSMAATKNGHSIKATKKLRAASARAHRVLRDSTAERGTSARGRIERGLYRLVGNDLHPRRRICHQIPITDELAHLSHALRRSAGSSAVARCRSYGRRRPQSACAAHHVHPDGNGPGGSGIRRRDRARHSRDVDSSCPSHARRSHHRHGDRKLPHRGCSAERARHRAPVPGSATGSSERSQAGSPNATTLPTPLCSAPAGRWICVTSTRCRG